MDIISHDFNLTMEELFIVTDALQVHKRSIEVQLSTALSKGDETAIQILWNDRQHVTDLHDMFQSPILQEADEWKLAEQGIFEIDMGDDEYPLGKHPIDDATDPYEGIDGDYLKDYFSKN